MGLNANEICYRLENAYVVAQDKKNTFLGKIESSFSSDSIFNEFGNFGSEYSSLSIFNEYGDFGSEFSSYSATNPITLTPLNDYQRRQTCWLYQHKQDNS